MKSFNSVTAVINKPGVFIRDSTCSSCDNCLNGNILDCTQVERNGSFKNHVIRKLSGKRKASLEADSSESEESDSEEEFEDCSEEEESSDEEEEISNVEECTPGRYILYKLTEHKYYVSSIVEYGDQCVTLKAARKYGEHQGKITFCWPTIDDIFTVKGGLNAENSLGLPDPVVDRRGSSLRFRKRAFGKVPLTYVI